MKKISLFGRKRTAELSEDEDVADTKKDELLALKLEQINAEARSTGTLQMLPTKLIRADKNQPRKQFRNIESLAKSIEEKGIIQPIIVTTRNLEGCYTIIAGERRYRAARLAKVDSIPCIIRDETDANVVILQLLENDQRENVSPLEESDALVKLIDKMRLSKSQVAKELGHDSSWVSIRLGLQKASEDIKALITDGIIEDIRTLHELRKFEEEAPLKAHQLITRLKNNTVSGSYRQVIASARREKKTVRTSTRSQQVKSVTYKDGFLTLDLGGSRPVKYPLEKAVIDQFLATLEGEIAFAE